MSSRQRRGRGQRRVLVGGLIALFVLLQHWIDRPDPELVSRHHRDHSDLRFGPPRRGPTSL